jgi:ABC-2 type transport system ATP-binding protein
LHFEVPPAKTPVVAGALSISGRGKEWTVICNGARAELPSVAAKLGAQIVGERAPSLNEIFVAHAGTGEIPVPA